MIILVIDVLSPRGHKPFNSLMLSSLLSLRDCKVLFVGHKECVDDCKKISYEIPDEYFFSKRDVNFIYKLKYRFLEFKKWLWVLNLVKKIGPDILIISSYETITFSIFSHLILYKTIAFNHNNIDELNNIFKRLFYRFISKSVVQVVFEEYIKEYLEKIIKIRNKIIVLPHIVEDKLIEKRTLLAVNLNPLFLFAPSSSNDTGVVGRLIDLQEQLLERGIYVVAKYFYDYNGQSVLFKKYFTDSEYKWYMNSCSAVYVPFRSGFNYRVSNVINEAISYGKPVISYLNKYTLFLKQKYSSLIYLLDREENIVSKSQEIKNWLEDISCYFFKERERFLKEHSSDRFVELLKKFLEEESVRCRR